MMMIQILVISFLAYLVLDSIQESILIKPYSNSEKFLSALYMVLLGWIYLHS